LGEDDQEVETDGGGETEKEQKSLRDLVAEGKVVRRSPKEAGEANMMEVEDMDNTHSPKQTIMAAQRYRKSSTLVVALQDKIRQLVKFSFLCFHRIFTNSRCRLDTGISQSNFFGVLALSHMSGIILRAYSINWLLAYLLSGVLASVSRNHQTVSYLQTHHGCSGFEADLLVVLHTHYLLFCCAIILCLLEVTCQLS
jgi:hypothetical protein